MRSLLVPRRTVAAPVLCAFHIHPDGGHSVNGTGDEQSLAVPSGERVVGCSGAGGNYQDVIAIRIERHHTLSIADVDVPQFIHGHAITAPVGELPHVEERAG